MKKTEINNLKDLKKFITNEWNLDEVIIEPLGVDETKN